MIVVSLIYVFSLSTKQTFERQQSKPVKRKRISWLKEVRVFVSKSILLYFANKKSITDNGDIYFKPYFLNVTYWICTQMPNNKNNNNKTKLKWLLDIRIAMFCYDVLLYKILSYPTCKCFGLFRVDLHFLRGIILFFRKVVW